MTYFGSTYAGGGGAGGPGGGPGGSGGGGNGGSQFGLATPSTFYGGGGGGGGTSPYEMPTAGYQGICIFRYTRSQVGG